MLTILRPAVRPAFRLGFWLALSAATLFASTTSVPSRVAHVPASASATATIASDEAAMMTDATVGE